LKEDNEGKATFPAYSLKTQVPGAKLLGCKTSRGDLKKGWNVHKSITKPSYPSDITSASFLALSLSSATDGPSVSLV